MSLPLPYNASSENEIYNFNLSIMKLYVMFLKKMGLFSGVYRRKHGIPPLRELPGRYCIAASSLSNTYTYKVMGKRSSDGLVHSQLWRGYLLDNLDSIVFVNDKHRESLVDRIKKDMRMNGTRRDERVREFLRKYEIKIIETANE